MGLHPRTTAYCNSDGRFAQIASWQYCSMAWPTLLDCRLRELRRNHCATAGQAQTRTYPGQRSSTGSCVPYRFRLDTGPCVGTGGGLAKSGKEIQDSKAAPQHGQLGADVRSYQEGARRLSNKVEKIIDAAIKKIYLIAERPDVAAVVEEVNLQCFNSKIKGKPAPNTIRARVSVLSDRLKLEKREGRKRAAEKYEPLKGHFPGADCPLAVAQIDHTPHGRHRGR